MMLIAIIAAASISAIDPVEVSRGLTGTIEFEYTGPKLLQRPSQSVGDDLSMRLSGPTEDGKYLIRFVGNKAGSFDLRDRLGVESGEFPHDVPSLPIVVVSNLPARYGTDLFGLNIFKQSLEPYYFRTLWIFGVAWAAVPIVFSVRKLIKRVPQMQITAAVDEPDVPERIRALVLRAASGDLTVEQRATLELLLITYRTKELGLEGLSPAQAIRRLRDDPRSGELLRTVEQWLHAPHSGMTPSSSTVQSLIIRCVPEALNASLTETKQ